MTSMTRIILWSRRTDWDQAAVQTISSDRYRRVLLAHAARCRRASVSCMPVSPSCAPSPPRCVREPSQPRGVGRSCVSLCPTTMGPR